MVDLFQIKTLVNGIPVNSDLTLVSRFFRVHVLAAQMTMIKYEKNERFIYIYVMMVIAHCIKVLPGIKSPKLRNESNIFMFHRSHMHHSRG